MKFRSGFERKLYEKAISDGQQLDFERKDTTLRYNKPATYLPDFVLPNGVLVESKGRFTSFDRTKMLRVREQNPEVDIRFVFQRAGNKLTKSPNSLTYGEWCDKHGFLWAETNIPLEWWNERKAVQPIMCT